MAKPRYTEFSQIEEDLKKAYGNEFVILEEPKDFKTGTTIFVRHFCGHEYRVAIRKLIDKETYCKFCKAKEVNAKKKLSQEEAENIIKDVCKRANLSFKHFKYENIRSTKIDFVCNNDKSHTFTLTFDVAKKVKGCRYCNNKRHKSLEERQKELDEKFNGIVSICKETGYKNAYENTWFICNKNPEHKKFQRSFWNLMNDDIPCPSCLEEHKRKLAMERDLPLLEKIAKLRNYTIEPFEYQNRKQILNLVCNKDSSHRWTNSITGIIDNKGGCQFCISNTSRAENEIYNFCKNYLSKEIIKQDRTLVPSPNTKFFYEIDIYIHDLRLAFEYNGRYWHNDENLIARSKGYFKNSDEYHQYKTDECLKKGVKLIHIDEDYWIKDRNKVLNFIKECIDKRIKETI